VTLSGDELQAFGSTVEFKKVSSYKGVRVILPEKDLNFRLFSKYRWNPELQDSMESLCLQTILPGADFEKLEEQILQRVRPSVSMLVAYLQNIEKIASKHGTIHAQALMLKLREILKPVAQAEAGNWKEMFPGDFCATFSAGGAGSVLTAATKASEVLRAYNSKAGDDFKIHAAIVVGVCPIADVMRGAAEFYSGNDFDKLAEVAGPDAVLFTNAFYQLLFNAEDDGTMNAFDGVSTDRFTSASDPKLGQFWIGKFSR